MEGEYYVYCPQAHAPKFKHSNFSSAVNEARRLHEKHPYNDFEVLKIETVIKGDLINEDEIPF